VTENQLDYFNSDLDLDEGRTKNELLVWPKEKIDSFAKENNHTEEHDVHLVLEYAEGDSIL